MHVLWAEARAGLLGAPASATLLGLSERRAAGEPWPELHLVHAERCRGLTSWTERMSLMSQSTCS